MFSKKYFKKIEKALGFELHKWQKDYIRGDSDYMPNDRRCGKTTAFILRFLLNYEVKYIEMNSFKYIKWHGINFPCDRKRPYEYVNNYYPREVFKINEKLRSCGIETCFIGKLGDK